jgi:hypothetical protein
MHKYVETFDSQEDFFMTKNTKSTLSIKERLESITLKDNQGGDLSKLDYAAYVLFGVAFPGILLIWGWL